jgi:hypothetical protein
MQCNFNSMPEEKTLLLTNKKPYVQRAAPMLALKSRESSRGIERSAQFMLLRTPADECDLMNDKLRSSVVLEGYELLRMRGGKKCGIESLKSYIESDEKWIGFKVSSLVFVSCHCCPARTLCSSPQASRWT